MFECRGTGAPHAGSEARVLTGLWTAVSIDWEMDALVTEARQDKKRRQSESRFFVVCYYQQVIQQVDQICLCVVLLTRLCTCTCSRALQYPDSLTPPESTNQRCSLEKPKERKNRGGG